MQMDRMYLTAGGLSPFTESSKTPVTVINRICFARTSNSSTLSQTDISYGFSTQHTRSRLDQQTPAIEKILEGAHIMIKIAAALPYDPDGEAETDKFLEKFEGNPSLNRPITKKYGSK